MTTLLPVDANNNPIPALRLKPGGAHQIEAGAESDTNEIPFAADTKVIGLYADGPVFIALGDAEVTATEADHYLPESFYYDIAISGGMKGGAASHIAVLAADANCTVYVSEKE